VNELYRCKRRLLQSLADVWTGKVARLADEDGSQQLAVFKWLVKVCYWADCGD
jgi:hypothetical protein